MASRMILRAATRAAKVSRAEFANILRQQTIRSNVRAFSAFPVVAAKHAGGKVSKKDKRGPISPRDELVSILNDELSFETTQAKEEESASGLMEIIDAHGFELIDVPDVDNVTLKKTIDDGTEILVKFVPSDVNSYSGESPYGEEEFSEEFENEKDLEEGEELDEEFNEGYLPTKIYITKPGKGTVVIDANSEPDNLAIEQVTFFKDSAVALSDDTLAEQTRKSVYWGPPFQNLDHRLQDAYYSYLESVGLDGEISEFISSYSKVKENLLYRKSLEDVKNFFES
ncbi:mitochondrial glycoprotein [Lipomyces kononenkoae]|uniref:Mitochondrial glycoprotein n=1 Tax=Lipomyces kononenkoae TaxID=34357 RepID=A0ACC3SY40_LIPKO